MDKEYEKVGFETLKIKAPVAQKFREFSRKISKSQSVTLLLMIEFFEEHGVSPAESFGPRMETMETRMSELIKKRMNGMIAIIKDIEKTQTKPTAAMLFALLEQAEPPAKKLIIEKKLIEKETKTPSQDKPRFQERKSIDHKSETWWKR